jgi:phosphoglycolate phosphatase
MGQSAIVLDFDGTIADVEKIMLEIYGPVAKKYDWPKMTRKDYYRLRKGSPRDVMRWANIKLWQVPKLLRVGRAEYKKHIPDVRLFEGIPQLLDELSSQGDICILSSNDHDTVRKILKNNRLRTEVNILHGSPIFGKDRALKKLLKSRKYDVKSSWMIGDEIRDIVAGKKVRMNTIGVTWGLQSEEGIKKASPDYIAKKPEEIAKIILKGAR